MIVSQNEDDVWAAVSDSLIRGVGMNSAEKDQQASCNTEHRFSAARARNDVNGQMGDAIGSITPRLSWNWHFLPRIEH
ncbi:hypothetical protein [Stieleria mannarensis]|uniref:hypothetical protein n=1 Tax=Stieleria mannarensis TaxID=2755585 RepID=UPI001C729C92|nr:hypothetical protein [Rhodopirellula sp. JC639]